MEFQRIKTEFYEEVIYSENGPGVNAYIEYYESMDPETAELIYQQVVQQEVYDAEIEEYAQAYSEMKPKEAAGIFAEETTSFVVLRSSSYSCFWSNAAQGE